MVCCFLCDIPEQDESLIVLLDIYYEKCSLTRDLRDLNYLSEIYSAVGVSNSVSTRKMIVSLITS